MAQLHFVLIAHSEAVAAMVPSSAIGLLSVVVPIAGQVEMVQLLGQKNWKKYPGMYLVFLVRAGPSVREKP